MTDYEHGSDHFNRYVGDVPPSWPTCDGCVYRNGRQCTRTGKSTIWERAGTLSSDSHHLTNCGPPARHKKLNFAIVDGGSN